MQSAVLFYVYIVNCKEICIGNTSLFVLPYISGGFAKADFTIIYIYKYALTQLFFIVF